MARGRRPGNVDTRGEILAAAKTVFEEHGYAATSLRAVARQAGVDPALIHHYFDGKPDLYVTAFAPDSKGDSSLGADRLVDVTLSVPVAERGETLVRTFVQMWDKPAETRRFRALHRSLMSAGPTDKLSPTRLVSATTIKLIADGIDPGQHQLRASLVGSQLMAIGTLRWTLRAKEYIGLTPDALARLHGPTVQAFLCDPLPELS